VISIPPPLYYAAGLVGGLLLHRAVPLPVGGRPATMVIGIAVAVLGVALTQAGVAAVIRPARPSSRTAR
jgi:hypothetical protein